MRNKTKIAVLVALVLAALVAVTYFAGIFGHRGERAEGKRAQRKIEEGSTGFSVIEGPDGPRLAAEVGISEKGTLRLEGQVVDEAQAPVAGAVVAINSNPRWTTTSEADGSFAFDGLRSREYVLEARAAPLYAGPVTAMLTDRSEPVILRARRGSELIVVVREQGTAKPIAGATVELRSTLRWTASTDDKGTVKLAGVGPGWRRLRVDAVGFAPAAKMIMDAETTATQKIDIQLARGAPVEGRVVAELGVPIAGVRVWASATSEPFPVVDPQIDAVVTDEQGRWRLPAVAAGTYQFRAIGEESAPGATAPTVLDGVTPLSDVEIRLVRGATVSGTVRSSDDKPVAHARVRITNAEGGSFQRMMQDFRTDAAGKFEMSGLPREPLDLVAVHEGATSAIVRADLVAALKADVVLRLDVTGWISGTVIDAKQTPVPGARVLAEPAEITTPQARAEWWLRVQPQAVADESGKFRIGGLPGGHYRIKAARPDAAPDALRLHPGVVAAVGDATVSVTVRNEALIIGSVAFEDGSTPEAFVVQVSRGTPVAFAGGAEFSLPTVGGTHDLMISGPAFNKKLVADVEVREDGKTDVGRIVVQRGRSVSGRVLDETGAPVAEAHVVGGLLLTGTGSDLNVSSQGFGVQETTSSRDGRFVLRGFDARPIIVVAEHSTLGRSASFSLPRGTSSAEIDLVLHATGSLEGRVTRRGQPLTEQVVIVNPIAASKSNFFVTSGPDGRFAFERLTAGEYTVSTIVGGGGMEPKDVYFRRVVIESSKRATADIAVSDGTLAIPVKIVTETGIPVVVAQVLAVSAVVDAPNLEVLRTRVPALPSWALHIRAAMNGQVSIETLEKGTYTVCAMPLPISQEQLKDMNRLMPRVMERAETLPIKCMPFTLASGSSGKLLEIKVPAAWIDPKSIE